MYSIVIPVLNEASSLDELHSRLDQVANEHNYDIELIFVDDGSTDDSWTIILSLTKCDRRVQGIRLRRNFGKASALSAGFNAARGEFVLTLDADLQDDPLEIPKLLDAMNQDLDVVSGWKRKRQDPWHKTIPSRVFNWLVSRLTGVQLHDHNSGFKCYRRQIFDEIRVYGELHRFVPVLAGARGYRVGEVAVEHRRRPYGVSKYGLERLPKGFLDLLTVKFLTGFGQRPQHVLGSVGLIFFFLGTLGIFVLTIAWFLTRAPFHWGEDAIHLTDRALFFYSIIALFFGGQLLSIGFLAELLTAHASRDTQPYSISERTTRQSHLNIRDDFHPVKDDG